MAQRFGAIACTSNRIRNTKWLNLLKYYYLLSAPPLPFFSLCCRKEKKQKKAALLRIAPRAKVAILRITLTVPTRLSPTV